MAYNHPQNEWVTRFLFPRNLDGFTILDCACGRGSWCFFIRTQIEGIPYIEGFELFIPYIENLIKLNLYDRVYELDIRKVKGLEIKFDIILVMNVLEHLEKDEALKVLKDLEEMSQYRLIVSLPIGKHTQGVGPDGNVFEIHRSTFQPKEMERYGYKIKCFYRHTRILRFVDKIRCWIFGLEYRPGLFVAWKNFDEASR